MNATPPRSRVCRQSCLLGCWAILVAGILQAAPAPLPSASEIDDPVAPLISTKPRNEHQQDHLDALAHYAAARMAQQREDNVDAMRHYARAYRLDPEAAQVLRDLVPVAFTLDRPSVAVRYALLAVEQDPGDPLLLRRLAAFVSDEGDQEKALLLYEKAAALAAARHEKPTPATVLVSMEMGRLYFVAKKYDKAAEQFAKVLQALDKPEEFGLDDAMRKALLGSSDVTYQLFGQAFYDAGRYDEAAATFEKANAVKADPPGLAFNMARIEFKRGKPDVSLARLNEFFAAKRSGEGTAPYELLADLLAAENKSDALLPRLEELRTADPDNTPLVYFLAEQYRKQDKLDAAEPLYRHLLKTAAKRPPAEAYQGLMEIYRKRRTAEPLLTVLGEAVEKAGSLQPLGEAGQNLEADAEIVTALIDFANQQQQADASKLDFGARLAVAHLALTAKKFDEADKWFDLAMQAPGDKSAEIVMNWGLDLFLADRYASATRVFRRAIDDKLVAPDNPAFHYYLSGALEMEGKSDEAIAVARQAAALQPKSARFASRVAWILYHAKRHDDAQREYEALIKSFDDKYDSSETRDVMRDARLVLSNIAVERGNLPVAEEWIEQVLDEFPGDVGALNDLGYLLADQDKHHERALRMTQQAVATEPKNAAYRDSLGWALFRLGRFDEAAAELKQALALDKNPDGVLYDHLGDVLAKTGDLPGATDAWNKALAAFEKRGDVEKIAAVKHKLNS
jgi:tetratricopeptide (TPR) repeat protein